MKKLLLTLGTIATVVAPIATVISCGSDDSDSTNNENSNTTKIDTTKTGTEKPIVKPETTQAEVDAEQTVINKLETKKIDSKPDVSSQSDAFDNTVADKFGVKGFVSKTGFKYNFENTDSTITITVSSADKDLISTNAAAINIKIKTPVELINEEQTRLNKLSQNVSKTAITLEEVIKLGKDANLTYKLATRLGFDLKAKDKYSYKFSIAAVGTGTDEDGVDLSDGYTTDNSWEDHTITIIPTLITDTTLKPTVVAEPISLAIECIEDDAFFMSTQMDLNQGTIFDTDQKLTDHLIKDRAEADSYGLLDTFEVLDMDDQPTGATISMNFNMCNYYITTNDDNTFTIVLKAKGDETITDNDAFIPIKYSVKQ